MPPAAVLGCGAAFLIPKARSMVSHVRPKLLAGLLLASLGGCVSAGADPVLVGPTYVVTAIDGAAAPGGEGAATIAFTEGQVSGFSGCNRFAGPVEIVGDRLTFGPLMGTHMACLDPVRSTLEANFLAALGGRIARYQFQDGQLQLLDATGLLVVEAVAAPAGN